VIANEGNYDRTGRHRRKGVDSGLGETFDPRVERAPGMDHSPRDTLGRKRCTFAVIEPKAFTNNIPAMELAG
jgi:hypothetical protein